MLTFKNFGKYFIVDKNYQRSSNTMTAKNLQRKKII